MACRPFGAKSLSKLMLGYCELDRWEQTSVKSESKYKIFIRENAFENVVSEMVAILSGGRLVNRCRATFILGNICIYL